MSLYDKELILPGVVFVSKSGRVQHIRKIPTVDGMYSTACGATIRMDRAQHKFGPLARYKVCGSCQAAVYVPKDGPELAFPLGLDPEADKTDWPKFARWWLDNHDGGG